MERLRGRHIIGRDDELAVASRFLDVAGRRLAVLELRGDPGIGKTTVWRAIVEEARARRYTVLSARPAEAETTAALSVVGDLLEPVPASAFAALPAPQRHALEVALLRVEPSDGAPEPRTIGTAVRTLLAALAEQGPVLIAVDDAHWLDRTSAAVLSFALRRLGEHSVGWLLATRPGVSRIADLPRLVGDEQVIRLDLGPMPVPWLHEVVERNLEVRLKRPVLVRTQQASGGNPLFAIEIARELIRQGGQPGVDAVPRDLRALLVERLRRLPPASREALLLASAMSVPTTRVVPEAALAPAEAAQLVRVDREGGVHFSHPLLAAAVYESATQHARRAVHDQLAALVQDPEERAVHLAAATTDPDAEVAAAIEVGAERARRRGAWEASAELLEQARRLTPPELPSSIRQRGVAAAAHYARAGDRDRARSLIDEVLAEPPPDDVRARALRVLAEICYHDEHYLEARRTFEAALECTDDPRLMTEVELGLAYNSSNLMDFETGRVHATRALRLAEAMNDTGAVAESSASLVMYDLLSGRGVDVVRLEGSLELEDGARVVPLVSRPTTIDAFVSLYVGDHDRARTKLDALRRLTVDAGDESDLAFVLLWTSWLETRCGNLDVAAELADEATRLARLTGSPSLAAWAGMQRAYVRAHRGEIEETRRAGEEGLQLRARHGNALLDLWIAGAVALAELSIGEAESALEACAPLLEVVETSGIGEPVPLFFLPDAIEALVMLGELDRADAVLTGLEHRAHELDRTWALATGARCRALLEAARGDLGAASEAVAFALAAHERIDLPFDLARARLAQGIVERRRRRRARAREAFEAARSLFEHVGAPLWVDRARAEMDRLGLQRVPADALTPAEQRVAELTAQGHTRRTVAAALHVSAKTVDATLSRVYRKLGIHSRAELGAWMAAKTTPGS